MRWLRQLFGGGAPNLQAGALPRYHVRFLRPETLEDGSQLWAVTFEEIPTCIGQGKTSAEAEAMLWHILPDYLERLRKHGQPIPPPLPTSNAEAELTIGIVPTITLHSAPSPEEEQVSTTRTMGRGGAALIVPELTRAR